MPKTKTKSKIEANYFSNISFTDKGFIELIPNIFKLALCQVKAESTNWTKVVNWLYIWRSGDVHNTEAVVRKCSVKTVL